ncbi:tryptophan synthase subunit alpha [Galenea microaerophila]
MKISKTFTDLAYQGRTALIPYLTAGDPHPEWTVPLMHKLVESGADIIELGVPFSDPMADGPVIQKAVERALAHQVSLHQVLQMVADFRQENTKTPIVLMGYLNPIEAMGYDVFAREAAAAGVQGVLTVDMPPEESEAYAKDLEAQGLEAIFLVSPTTPENRLQAVNQRGRGFVYYVSLKGVTGSKALDVEDVRQQVSHLRGKVDLPVGIGFGIRDAEAAYQMAKLGDGVIVGSALVSVIEENPTADFESLAAKIQQKMTMFRQAIDKADAEVAGA